MSFAMTAWLLMSEEAYGDYIEERMMAPAVHGTAKYRFNMNTGIYPARTYHHDATAYSSAGAYRNAKNGGKS